jgi:hypothetical protein
VGSTEGGSAPLVVTNCRASCARHRSAWRLIRNVEAAVDAAHLVTQAVKACLKPSIGFRQSADVPANPGQPDLNGGETIADFAQLDRQSVDFGVGPTEVDRCQIVRLICHFVTLLPSPPVTGHQFTRPSNIQTARVV